MARLMVETLILTARSRSHSRRCSSSVASGFFSNCSHKACRSSVVAPILGLIPGLLLGSTSPVSLRRLSHRLSVAEETPKTLTASFLGMPPSTAASIFSLRSFE